MILVAPFLLAGVCLCLGFFTVRSGRAVVVLRWGRYVETLRAPGLHYRFPVGLRTLSMPTGPRVTQVDVGGTNSLGDAIRMHAHVGFQVTEPKLAALEIDRLDHFVDQHVTALLRQAMSGSSSNLEEELRARISGAGVEIRSFSVSTERTPCLSQVDLARQWAQSVVEAHAALQAAAIAAAHRLHEAAEAQPTKTARADFLSAATVHIDQVAGHLPPVSTPPGEVS